MTGRFWVPTRSSVHASGRTRSNGIAGVAGRGTRWDRARVARERSAGTRAPRGADRAREMRPGHHERRARTLSSLRDASLGRLVRSPGSIFRRPGQQGLDLTVAGHGDAGRCEPRNAPVRPACLGECPRVRSCRRHRRGSHCARGSCETALHQFWVDGSFFFLFCSAAKIMGNFETKNARQLRGKLRLIHYTEACQKKKRHFVCERLFPWN